MGAFQFYVTINEAFYIREKKLDHETQLGNGK